MTCSFDNCDLPVKNFGQCKNHYMQWYRAQQGDCTFDGCSKKARSRGRCKEHYEARNGFYGDSLYLDTPQAKEDFWLFVKKELGIES
jgi:hypothetical protein